MRYLVYCGTVPIGPDNTRKLLASTFSAIWCPPSARRVPVSEGDGVWLVWKSEREGIPMLLGGGRIMASEPGQSLWTNRTAPGVREAAQQLGYGGPTNMSFLRISEPVLPVASIDVDVLRGVSTGLSELDASRSDQLMRLLPI
jgi:hypothetical protein